LAVLIGPPGLELIPQQAVCETTTSSRIFTPHLSQSESIAPMSAALPSVGSADHGSGKCQPCNFFWKPQGCINGAECRHCHICDSNELKKRKTGKVAALKAQAKGEKLNQQAQALYWEAHNLIYKANMISAHSSMLVQPQPVPYAYAAQAAPEATRLPLSSLV